MKKIGLVLSGGMGKGAYQIGALFAISEYFLPSDFCYVSAASIGALNTYAYLTDNLVKARNIWRTVNIDSEKEFIPKIMRSDMLSHIISEIVCDRKIPNNFYIPLLDIANKDLNYFNLSKISSDNIEEYLKASIAMPFYNKGIQINNKILYDGAVIDNIPIFPLVDKNLDYIICIYFDKKNYVFENEQFDNRVVKLSFTDNTFIRNSLVVTHESVEYMLSEGYNQAKKELSKIFDETNKIDIICSHIRENNESVKDKMLRITGDVIVNNMNKLVKRAVKKNLIE